MQRENFSTEEMEEILREAIRAEGDEERISREILLRTAQELGLSDAAIREAENRLIARKNGQLQAAETEILKAEFRDHLRGKLIAEWASIIGLCAFLTGVNLLTSGWKFTWAIWPVGIFVLLMIAETVEVFFKHRDPDAYERWLRRREQKSSELTPQS